jgi:hypothetical protein
MTDDRKFADRRRAFRVPTSIAAVARTARGLVHHVEISDLTPDGCALTAPGQPLAAGAVYALKIDGLESLPSIARWTAGARSGLQFERPLYPAIADHIAARHPRAKRP